MNDPTDPTAGAAPAESTTTHGAAAPYVPPSGMHEADPGAGAPPGGERSTTMTDAPPDAVPPGIAATSTTEETRPAAPPGVAATAGEARPGSWRSGPFQAPNYAVPPSVAPPPNRAAEPEPELPELQPGDFVVHDGGTPYLVVAVFPAQFTDDRGGESAGYVLGRADLFTHPQPRSLLYTEDEWRNPGARTPAGK